MKKKYPSLTKQLEILGFQLLTLGFCAQPAICAGPVYIPGYYGSAAAVLPRPAENVLPTGGKIVGGLVDANSLLRSGNKTTIQQQSSRAIIEWDSFNIGSSASVQFVQPDSSSKVLNKVMGNEYSQIFGTLTANGQVYLLNQNGILFGKGAQVNVHSLTASALNFTYDFLGNKDFADGGTESYKDASSPSATVANHGTITAGNLGSVFLIGPQVENNGTITAPSGRVALLAGGQVDITQTIKNEDGSSRQSADFIFTVQGSDDLNSVATNFGPKEDPNGTYTADYGKISTPQGFTGMYGKVVNQNGLISADTALEKNGKIVLKATTRVTTGADSRTEALVSDAKFATPKVVDASNFQQSKIDITADQGVIVHQGSIKAPGGDVTLTAQDRVYLAEGSSIDVAGSWVDMTAEDRLIKVQLNSQELRDAFVYKNGPLAKQWVLVDVITGLPLADISGYFDSKPLTTAQELTTKGGTISLKTTGANGDVIVKQNAQLDFAGGGLKYADGFFASTKVRIGNTIYNLQDVPTGVPIDEVLGSFSKEHKRYGKVDTWSGIYYGGSTSILSYLPAFKQGADAGTLKIDARKIVLDGTMDAHVERGIYQNALEDPTDSYGNKAAIGRKVPKAGTLQIGDITGTSLHLADAIVIKEEMAPATVSVDTPLTDHDDPVRLSELSSETLNKAGLGSLSLYANTTIKVDDNVNLKLAELGSVDFRANNIEHRGSIRIPSGNVSFTLLGNTSSDNLALKDRIFLSDHSMIDVSGTRLDNSTASLGSPLQSGFTRGGAVNLTANTGSKDSGEVILAEKSVIDVSGGYLINSKGTITGGNNTDGKVGNKPGSTAAGSIAIVGNTVQPDGQLVGLALEGSEGGTLSLHTDNLTIAKSSLSLPNGFDAQDNLPENLQHHLFLAENRFDTTGFSHITLKSANNLVVEQGVNFTSSSTRIAKPSWTATGYRLEETNTVTTLPETFGTSSLALAAGQTLGSENPQSSSVAINTSAALTVAPGGTIRIEGPQINMGGSLNAPGGAVSLKATETDVVLTSGAEVNVAGTTLPDLKTSLPGQALNKSAIGGGSVTLSAVRNVVLEPDSQIDVSGSEAVTNLAFDNKGGIAKTTLASAAGSVNVTFQNSFTSDGQLKGTSQFSWLPGGSLTVEKTRTTGNFADTTLTVHEEKVNDWQNNGFDNFIFSSRLAINFESAANNDDITIAANRGLTLNGSALVGSAGQNITLSAPLLRLSNTVLGTNGDLQGSPQRTIDINNTPTSAALALNGDFIDIQGELALSGFKNTTIHSTNDLRLYDYLYFTPATKWSGGLHTAGNLTLQAAAIYPGMHPSTDSLNDSPSSFTFSADGKITINAPENSSRQAISIYSAGGRLELDASDIENHGILAAPMGTIVLNARNSIVLADESMLSTRGEAMTLYGQVNVGQWTVGGYRNNGNSEVTVSSSIPVTADLTNKSVALSASVITQAANAVIDVGGGGSLFSYEFLPGYEGSVTPLGINPKTKATRSVILPDNSVILPGKTVYLEGTEGLKSGTYSLLPVEYAFLPGALIIENTGTSLLPGTKLVTAAGYTEIAGYASDRAISQASPLRTGYIIRKASDVLAEGKFDTSNKIVAGNAGEVQITAGAGSSILAGSILGDAMSGYQGGSLILGAEKLFIGFLGSMSDEERSAYNLTFDTSRIGENRLDSLQLGSDSGTAITKELTIGAGSTVKGVPTVQLTATDSITLEEGAQIYAEGNATTRQPGTLTLNTNTLISSDDTLLRASDGLYVNVNNSKALKGIQVDKGTFQVNEYTKNGSHLYFGPPPNNDSADVGFYVSSNLLEAFHSIDSVILNSRSGITFLGNVTLDATNTLDPAKGNLTLDSPYLTVGSGLTDTSVTIKAGNTLRLKNSYDTIIPSNSSTGNTLSLLADTIRFEGSGEQHFGTFNKIDFKSTGETVFNGTGSLHADMTGSGTLTFAASRYLFDMMHNIETSAFSLSDFTIDGGSGGAVTMKGSGPGVGSTGQHRPGNLTVQGNAITLDGAYYDMPGGNLNFQAAQDITVKNSSSILATGGQLNIPVMVGGVAYDNSISLVGGQVTMQSKNGGISIDDTSTIDTSAPAGLAGGTITLAAHKKDGQGNFLKGIANGVDLKGTVKGDRISIDTSSIDNFTALASTIRAGVFSKLVDLRARTGDVLVNHDATIGVGADVTTNHFILTADQGAVDISGTIDVSGQDKGGTAEIYANNNLTLHPTSQIIATGNGTNNNGGSVFLASATGAVNAESGSLIDVSGPDHGGTVTFRASRDVIKSSAMLLDGEIRGASEASVHAFRVYNNTAGVTTASVTNYKKDITDVWPALQTAWKYPSIALIPEVEVRSSGDMTITSGLDTLETLRTAMPSGIPGVFTFRAAKNLNVTSNIIDTTSSNPVSDGKRDSWDLNFVAGADLASARLLTVSDGSGDFTLGTKVLGNTIYTESGNINFAAGKNVTLYALPNYTYLTYMPGTEKYNLASFDGAINGYAGNDLVLPGGVIQTAVSDIALQIRNNINISQYVSNGSWDGAIRTTGRAPLVDEIKNEYSGLNISSAQALERYWDYRNGGNITLAVGGNITGDIDLTAGNIGWDYAYNDRLAAAAQGVSKLKRYGAAYGKRQVGTTNGWGGSTNNSSPATTGIATMAGGSIDIQAENIFGQIGAFGHRDDPSKEDTYGQSGDLTVYVRGTLGGRLLAADGQMRLTTLVDVTNSSGKDTMVELGSGSLVLQALGNVTLGTICNPALTAWSTDSDLIDNHWLLTYGQDSSVTINALLGNTLLSGKQDFFNTKSSTSKPTRVVKDATLYRLLPSSLNITAGQDIQLTSGSATFTLAPSASGQLNLIAGADINGKTATTSGHYQNSTIYMSAADPAAVYGDQRTNRPDLSSDSVAHITDDSPVGVHAGHDIANLSLLVPKQAEIFADNDIREINYQGQNLHDADVSLISASHDLIQQSYQGVNDSNPGIKQAGHGLLLVQAGGDIDLGSSDGIQSTTPENIGRNSVIGLFTASHDQDQYHSYKGPDVTVLSGYAIKENSINALNAMKTAINKYDQTLTDYDNGRKEYDAKDYDLLTKYTASMKTYQALLEEYNTQLANFNATTGTSQDRTKAIQTLASITTAFSKNLAEYGGKYNDMYNSSDKAEQNRAARLKDMILETIITPLLADKKSDQVNGNISMTQSVIKTTSGQDDLHILAAGKIDIGTATIGKTNSTRGILTEGGGNINIFSQYDINVNESRVATYFGGDIFLMSNQKDINAGRGSNTSVSKATGTPMPTDGIYMTRFQAPIPGSGIRALTADPDGAGPISEPVKGAITMVAWQGVIDAGEAGISGKNVSLAATKVLNSQNISFSNSGVGVPTTAEAGPSLGALAGASTVSGSQTANQSIGQQAVESGKELAASMNKVSEGLNIKTLVFKLEGFSEESKPEQIN